MSFENPFKSRNRPEQKQPPAEGSIGEPKPPAAEEPNIDDRIRDNIERGNAEDGAAPSPSSDESELSGGSAPGLDPFANLQSPPKNQDSENLGNNNPESNGINKPELKGDYGQNSIDQENSIPQAETPEIQPTDYWSKLAELKGRNSANNNSNSDANNQSNDSNSSNQDLENPRIKETQAQGDFTPFLDNDIRDKYGSELNNTLPSPEVEPQESTDTTQY